MWRPWTKSQLQHHRKGWETEASYRIAGISAIFLLLLMAISQGLQRTGTSERYRLALQLTSGWLLLYYFRLLWRIIVGSQRKHELICPNCGQIFGCRIDKVFKNGQCPRCAQTVVVEDPPTDELIRLPPR